MKRKLYTIILDYRGGTYISQISDTSLNAALAAWVDALKEDDVRKWKLKKDPLKSIVNEDTPIALQGCKNVWCICGTVNRHLALINIVKTAEL